MVQRHAAYRANAFQHCDVKLPSNLDQAQLQDEGEIVSKSLDVLTEQSAYFVMTLR